MLRKRVHFEEVNKPFDEVSFYEDLKHLLRVDLKQLCQEQNSVQLSEGKYVLNLADDGLNVRLDNRETALLKRTVVKHEQNVAVYFRAARKIVY